MELEIEQFTWNAILVSEFVSYFMRCKQASRELGVECDDNFAWQYAVDQLSKRHKEMIQSQLSPIEKKRFLNTILQHQHARMTFLRQQVPPDATPPDAPPDQTTQAMYRTVLLTCHLRFIITHSVVMITFFQNALERGRHFYARWIYCYIFIFSCEVLSPTYTSTWKMYAFYVAAILVFILPSLYIPTKEEAYDFYPWK